MKIKCPFCNKNQGQEPIKSWAYGRMIEKRTKEGTKWGASVNCSQYHCECGKPFRFYLQQKENLGLYQNQKKLKFNLKFTCKNLLH